MNISLAPRPLTRPERSAQRWPPTVPAVAGSSALRPATIAAVVLAGIMLWHRRRTDTIGVASRAHNEIETAITGPATPLALEQADEVRDRLIQLIERVTGEEQELVARDRANLIEVANLFPAKLRERTIGIDVDQRIFNCYKAVLADIEATWGV